MNRNKQIDSLRGILSIMIMFFHFSYRFSQIYNISTIDFYTLKHWRLICVGCFFIITGFFLLPSELHDFSFIKFIRKKILRIYPSYFLCITIIFISVNKFGLEYRETRFFDYLLNVFMLNGFFGTPYVDGSHWYITYLLIFYILAGILLKISKITNKNYIYFCFMWLILKSLLKVGTKILPIPNFLYMLIGGNYLEFILIGITLRKISNHIKKGIYRLK